MRGVGVGCVRACGGCVRGVSGCVGGPCLRPRGVSAVCAASGCAASQERVCAPGAREPAPLPSAGRFFCVCPRRGLCRTSRPLFPPRSPGTSGAARGRPPGDFLFSASCLWPSSLTPAVAFRVSPGTRAAGSPLGTSSFPRGITQTQTRVFFATCAAHVAFIRRRRPPRPPSLPHRSTHATPNFTPPLKTPPRPSGTHHAARNGCRPST